MYDKHPVYPHHADLFWAYEPYKTIYVLQRILTTLLLVPCWAVYYAVLPRSRRPRPSWSIKQIIIVKFMKRISRVVEVAGVTWGTRNPLQEPDFARLKETRFEWAPPLPDDLRTGIVNDCQVECKPVGMYVWPKDPHPSVRGRKTESHQHQQQNNNSHSGATMVDDLEAAAADAPPRLVGVYLHGGGYCHYSAHESAGTSRIPRRLVKDGHFQEIYAVEYRLLQHAPVPAAIQDAAAVYTHLVLHELGATKAADGRYYIPEHPHRDHAHPSAEDGVFHLPPGSLSRADPHRTRPDPIPLAPTSPSTSSPSQSRSSDETLERQKRRRDSIQPALSGNDAIPTLDIDTPPSPTPASTPAYGTPAMTPENTPYPQWKVPKGRSRTKIILIGDSSGGNLVLALARWIRDEAKLPPPDGMLLLSPSCDPSHTLPQVPASRRPRPHEATDYLLDTPEPRAILSRTFLGHHPPEFVYSPYISPSSEWVISVFHGAAAFEDLETLEDIRAGRDTRDWREGPEDVPACAPEVTVEPATASAHGDPPINSLPLDGESSAGAGSNALPNGTENGLLAAPVANRPNAPGRTFSTNPFIRDPSGQGLFTNFPRALVVVGDAERLEREVVALEKGMERDGVRVRMVWAKDGCHDLLILAHWDEKVREGIWMEIARWVREIEAEP